MDKTPNQPKQERFQKPFSDREFKRMLASTPSPWARQVIKAWQYGVEPKPASGGFRVGEGKR